MPLRPWIALFRPWNAAIAAAAVWVGWACLRTRPLGPPEWQLALWGSIAMFLLVAAGNADNDALDAEADRVNRPRRPIVSGAVSRGGARGAAFALYAAGILAAWIGTPVHGMLAGAMAGLLFAYNRSLKGTPVAGNLVIALLCALAVWFTEFPLPPRGALAAAAFAFLATFARELVKDAEDVAGDRAAGLRTLAVVSGTSAARKLAFAATVVLLALLPAPMLMGYGWPYAVVAALLAGPALAPLLGELAKPDANFARAQKLLKLLMLAGMVALWAGTMGR
jgi:geranylgeranylglycerol-phosphate geranylgeranyltransferase